MKDFIALAIACFLALAVAAQTPQYHTGGSLTGGRVLEGGGTGFKIQTIYHPGDFPAAPAGQLTCIYLRVGRTTITAPDSGVIYYDWRIRMGSTNLNGFKNMSDSFLTELATVVDIDTFRIPNGDSFGAWVKMPLVHTSFGYDRVHNFVVEITVGPDPINGFDLLGGTFDPANNRQLNNTVPKGSPMPAIGGSSSGIIAFGFDIIPVGIKDADNIRSFVLFPNPSNGRFVVSFEARKPVRLVSVTASNMLGQVVFRQDYSPGGATSFFREVSLGNVPKGMYAVEVAADGERIVRRLQVE